MRLATYALLLSVVSGVVVLSSSHEERNGTPSQAAPEVLAKQARIAAVVADLEHRDTTGLSDAQREARHASLERLRLYGERGVFTLNDQSPDRDIPFFIDSGGRRCALAHMIESSGRTELLASLMRDANNAWISEIDDDPALGGWLAANGFTTEEVAYIQAPGLVDLGDGRFGRAPPPPAPTGPQTPTGHDPAPPQPAPSPAPTPLGPAVRTPPTGAVRGAPAAPRSKKSSSAAASWETWWFLNGDALSNPRAAYHDDSTTARSYPLPGEAPDRPQRPDSSEIERVIIPVLDRVAASDDLHLAATGVISLARASLPARNGAALQRILAYLGTPGAPYRNYAILALGIVPDPAAVAPLRSILLDQPQGRKMLAESGPIAEHLRALAAIALGRAGDAQVAKDLIGLLADESRAGVDLRAACVTALGLLSSDVVAQKEINPFLLSHLDDRSWPPIVAAQVPVALARSQDRSVLPALVAIVDRFQATREVRQSAAIAIGLLGDGLTSDLVRPLMALAQRDPDATARQFAIMSLAELSMRELQAAGEGTKERDDLMRHLTIFFTDGMGSAPRQIADRGWYAIAGALFARKVESARTPIAKALVSLADNSAAQGDRSAAALALGLLPGDAATGALRRLLASTSDPRIVGYAAESLGMHGDTSVKERLVELARADPNDSVRYRAVLGLARLRAKSLMPLFVTALGESRSQTVQAALTRAIGTIGDRSAIADLTRLAVDPAVDRATRERAVGALGLIGQRGDIAWSMDLKRGCNFTTDAPALQVVLETF